MYGFSQNSIIDTKYWKLVALNGEVNIDGSYWDQQTFRNTSTDKLINSNISGSIFLNSRSYVWHPNFLSLDINAGFSPETGQQLSLITPDRYEVNTLKKLFINALVFKKNALNFNLFTNINSSYNKRENLTNIKTSYKNWGGTFTYNNKYIPFYISYNQDNRKQIELESNRNYTTQQNNLEGVFNKSFGLNDSHQFIYSHSEYVYEDSFLFSQQNEKNRILTNKNNSWVLNNKLFFDAKKKYRFSSRISNDVQKGNFNFKRLQALENIYLTLPSNFKFKSSYNFFNIKDDIQNSKQHDINSALTHQLYKSLRTSISYQYNTIFNSQYKEKINRVDFILNYVKKIPFNGILSINYQISNNHQEKQSETLILSVSREEQRLSDDEILLLNSQNINTSSVVVKDVTGTIIYSLNLDYILIPRNEFLEIQRMPGGQIPNNTNVFIDYTSLQPRSYQFNILNNFLGTNISLFKNKVNFYFNTSKQDYINPLNEEFLTLNFFNRNVYGTRFKLGSLNGGIEIDNYKSTIIPYYLIKYFLTVHGSIRERIYFSLNGSLSDYQMILKEGLKQKDLNISGNVFYMFNNNTKLKLEGSNFNKQAEGIEGINLKLKTLKLDLLTHFRQISIKSGVELYKNKIFNEELNFIKFNIHISRKF